MAFDAYFPHITLPKGKTDYRMGDGIAMICAGQVMLVDGFQGGQPTDGLKAWLSQNKVKDIDIAVLTHPHWDHYNGLLQIEEDSRFHIKLVYMYDPLTLKHGCDGSANGRSVKEDMDNAYKWIRAMQVHGTRVLWIDKGSTVKFGDITWKIFREQPTHFTEEDQGNGWAFVNNGSLCLYSPETELIFPGDGPDDQERMMDYFGGEVSGTDVTHHMGSWTQHNAKALKRRGCVVAFGSCVEKNGPGTSGWTQYGGRRIKEEGIPLWGQEADIYIHADNGTITFRQGDKTISKSIPYHREIKEGWQKNATGWWYRYKDGSWPADCMVELPWSQGIDTFCFDMRGYMVIGWRKFEGKWYYFDENGTMVTGWRKINGKWYYLSRWEKGAMVNGWQKLDGKTYYFDASGAMVTDWQKIDGRWYYFSAGGAMQIGWIVWKGAWFYLDPTDGHMHTGWLDYKSKRCYLDGSGRALCDCIRVIDGKTYQFDDGCYATEITGNGKEELNGCDVASYQAGIDFSRMTTTDFAIVKATQGSWYVNPYADIQYNGAKAAGKLLGMYHYAEGQDPIAEAQYFIKKVGSRVGESILALDWEGHDNSKFNSDAEVAWVLKFAMEIYRLTKVHIFLYMSKSVTRRRNWAEVAKDVRLWCAQYANQDHTDYKVNPWTDNGGFGAWKSDTIRQYSSKGRVTGYGKDLDINRAYMSRAEWLAAAGKNTVVATATTEKPKTQWSAYVSMTTSPVKISNSGSDENGKYKGGKAGDQTGKEWRIRDWYNYPWNCVLRHPLAEVRACLATMAVKAAENDNIGYDQLQRDDSGIELAKNDYDPSKIKKPVESDCSKGVIDNTKGTGHTLGILELQNIKATYTGNMRAAYKAAGFYVLTESKYLTSSDYLLAGDILLNDKHHTCTVITNGSKSGDTVVMPLVKKGSTGAAVEQLQEMLIAQGYSCGKWGADGDFGNDTHQAVKSYQRDHGLEVDGEVGPMTWAALIEGSK